MSIQSNKPIIVHINSLIDIMEQSTDSETKGRLDREITRLMGQFNIKFEDLWS